MIDTLQKTNPNKQNVELGKVAWLRDYDTALQQSVLTAKPILLFFQEIPGCSTCVNYGRDVLSHPLMVEMIENEFIPLAIYNNRPGKDAEILRLYREPSWNNPVAHFIDHTGKDIIEKLANNYHPLAMYQKMLAVLRKHNKPIANYILSLGDDLAVQYGFAKRTVYATPCFWSGETSMAQRAGVLVTMAGWIRGEEVVQVMYDPQIVSEGQLNAYAKEQGFSLIGNHADFMLDDQPQYYVNHSAFSYLPLSLAQRTKINYAIPYAEAPESYLSPKQLALLNGDTATLRAIPNRYKDAIERSWQF